MTEQRTTKSGGTPRPDLSLMKDDSVSDPGEVSPSPNGSGHDHATNRVVVEFAGARRAPGTSRPTEDEELFDRPVPKTPRPKAPELGAFTHTDPWRVLRIQGEFVHGFNALAEVGASVAVFGSARLADDSPH